MPFIETPLVAKVAIRGQIFNQDIVNTLWFERTDEGEWVDNELESLANDVLAWWRDSVMLHLSEDYGLADITATAQWTATAPSVIVVPSIATDGQVAIQSSPTSNCLTITFLSNSRGRSYRGRNYISGIPNNDITDNLVEEGFATPIRAAYVSLNGDVTTVACQHVICSHYTNGAPRASGVTVPVTGYRYHDLNIDSQRRRLNGRGS